MSEAKHIAFISETAYLSGELDSEVRHEYDAGAVFAMAGGSNGDTFQGNPVVIIEVLSPSTRRTDQTEKKDAYFSIPSLDTYVLLEQDTERAIVHHRGPEGFEAQVVEGADATLHLPGIEVRLTLAELYA